MCCQTPLWCRLSQRDPYRDEELPFVGLLNQLLGIQKESRWISSNFPNEFL